MTLMLMLFPFCCQRWQLAFLGQANPHLACLHIQNHHARARTSQAFRLHLQIKLSCHLAGLLDVVPGHIVLMIALGMNQYRGPAQQVALEPCSGLPQPSTARNSNSMASSP
jgi:hypothetical protein